jgi:hypothetical protein
MSNRTDTVHLDEPVFKLASKLETVLGLFFDLQQIGVITLACKTIIHVNAVFVRIRVVVKFLVVNSLVSYFLRFLGDVLQRLRRWTLSALLTWPLRFL